MDSMDNKERDKVFDTWLKETSNGMLAYALKKATGETLTILNTRDGGPGDFVFDNIRIHSWFSNFGVNSDYEEPGTPDIVLPLYTWAKCPELRMAAAILYEEKGINVVTDNVLSTVEASSLAGLPEFNLLKELKKTGSKKSDKPDLEQRGGHPQNNPAEGNYNARMDRLFRNLSVLLGGNEQDDETPGFVDPEIADFVLKGMNEILRPEFSIHRNNLTNEIYIKANYQSVKDVEEQSPLFKEKIKGIVDYFYNDAAVQEKTHNR